MQDKIFKKLKMRFVTACLITAGVFLLVVFAAVFGIVYNNSRNQIYSTIDNALYGRSEPVFSGKNDYIKYVVQSGGVSVVIGADRYDSGLLTEILGKAEETGKGKFSAGGFQFYVDNAQTADIFGAEATVYIIYDATVLNENVLTLGLTLAVSYAAGLGLIAVIAVLYSKSAVRPVENAFQKQKELIANASHELKTPLTIISTNLSVVKSDESKTVKENEKWLDNVDSCVARMDSLILDMLELSKLENAPLPKETVNLSQLARGAALSMDAACFEKKIDLSVNITPDITFYTNEKQFEKLTLILLENAVKYADDGGYIDLTLAATNKKIILSVSNSGDGIPPEKIDKIFDRFYRSDTARTSDENHSFGLGLAIAKAITDNLGGKIGVESREKEYTKFTVTFSV